MVLKKEYAVFSKLESFGNSLFGNKETLNEQVKAKLESDIGASIDLKKSKNELVEIPKKKKRSKKGVKKGGKRGKPTNGSDAMAVANEQRDGKHSNFHDISDESGR